MWQLPARILFGTAGNFLLPFCCFSDSASASPISIKALMHTHDQQEASSRYLPLVHSDVWRRSMASSKLNSLTKQQAVIVPVGCGLHKWKPQRAPGKEGRLRMRPGRLQTNRVNEPMTEERLACTDPVPMLEFLRCKISERKLRLFAVGCCRRVWALIKDDRFRTAVRAAELFSDSMVTKEYMNEARNVAIAAFVQLRGGEDEAPAAAISAAGIPAPKKSFFVQLLDAFDDPWWEDEFDKGDLLAPAVVAARHAAWAAAHAQGQRLLSGSPAEAAEKREQAAILRDIFGNPFRTFTLAAHCAIPTATSLAKSIYDERAFDRLPILADAMEEAGYTNQYVLSHCRQQGEHVRGCWTVDLLLGKG
jgi:hypothetical protein